MMRQRRGAPAQEEDSSSEEEDAFAKLSKKSKKGGAVSNSACPPVKKNSTNSKTTSASPMQLPAPTTSSMKRHHLTRDDNRKAKMDALLQELEAEKQRNPIDPKDRGRGFVPDKKGSFCEPGEEHLTTNIFVGNLSPSITEEELTDLFRQFGDLYSVKIMWPRSTEERFRNRNTGFVCFMNREDAEEAMRCDETDPFNAGRRIMMRWGKNVKKFIKRGTGGVPIPPIKKRAAHPTSGLPPPPEKRLKALSEQSSTAVDPTVLRYDPKLHATNAIEVKVPDSAHRVRFITTVASFVSKDGLALEQKLKETEAANPSFQFLHMPQDKNSQQAIEHLYYRWRVYSFCQGDGAHVWRTEPFQMFETNGSWWIPPPLNPEAARIEEQEQQTRQEDMERQKKQRRRLMTGRQLEQARRLNATDGGICLTREEMEQFDKLIRKQLCASRESICAAMAFCFEKSAAAKQIAKLLKEILLEDENTNPGISVETRIARLYLLSDVLFNSQQPGVRNAFLYRDCVERMAPDVFTSLGKHGAGTLGRMTKNKLSNAVSAVLGAWTSWSVYNPIFLDELHDRYEGKEIKKPEKKEESKDEGKEDSEEEDVNANAVKVIPETQRQTWTEDGNEPPGESKEEQRAMAVVENKEMKTSVNEAKDAGRAPAEAKEAAADDIDIDDIDGEPLDESEESDIDGEPLEDGDFDELPTKDETEDADGASLQEGDIDGECLDDDDV